MRETMLTPSMKILNLEWPLVPVQIEHYFLRQYSQLQFLITGHYYTLHHSLLKPITAHWTAHHHSAGIEVTDEMLVSLFIML